MGERQLQETPANNIEMFHKAVKLEFAEGTVLKVTFSDGMVKGYDMSSLFSKYHQLELLKDRELFCSGKLTGPYLIIWNDDLDIGTDTVYEEGWTVRQGQPFPGVAAGDAVLKARAERDMTQKELSELTGIDQSDISKIERGVANPTIGTIDKIASALGGKLHISIDLDETLEI